MKVVCAPDTFKESLSAVEAADAMAVGVLRAVSDAQIDRCPIGDGGEGTLESLLQSVEGRYVGATVSNASGRSIDTHFGLLDDRQTAYIESAAAIGLAAIPPDERDVMCASSFGVGQLVRCAFGHSPEQIIVGVGGSATNDCGCGMAQALGVRFFDAADNVIEAPISAGMLMNICRIDATNRARKPNDTRIVVACDVDIPLTGPRGAAYIFSPQKGATESQVTVLDDGLRHVAGLIRRDLGIDVETIPGAGAAGGLGAGLIAFTGAEAVSGIDSVLQAVQFDERVHNADLCLTGEGSLDAQSLAGKACIGMAGVASSHGVPTVVLAGRLGRGASQTLDAGVTEYVAIGEGLSAAQSIRQAATLLADAAAEVTRNYR